MTNYQINFEEAKVILDFFEHMMRETFIFSFEEKEIILFKKIYDESSEEEKIYIENYYKKVFNVIKNI